MKHQYSVKVEGNTFITDLQVATDLAFEVQDLLFRHQIENFWKLNLEQAKELYAEIGHKLMNRFMIQERSWLHMYWNPRHINCPEMLVDGTVTVTGKIK